MRIPLVSSVNRNRIFSQDLSCIVERLKQTFQCRENKRVNKINKIITDNSHITNNNKLIPVYDILFSGNRRKNHKAIRSACSSATNSNLFSTTCNSVCREVQYNLQSNITYSPISPTFQYYQQFNITYSSILPTVQYYLQFNAT